jgi:hypothetical protein
MTSLTYNLANTSATLALYKLECMQYDCETLPKVSIV